MKQAPRVLVFVLIPTLSLPILSLGACDGTTIKTSKTDPSLSLGNSATYSLVAGNNNDLAFTGSFALVYPDPSGSSVITGVDPVNFSFGDILWIVNNSPSDYVTLSHDSLASLSANRLHLPDAQAIVIAPGRSVAVEYDFTNAWQTLTQPGVRDVVSTSTPSRSLGTAFCPSSTHATAAYYSVRISTPLTVAGGAVGRIELLVDAANPPTTVRARVAGGSSGVVLIGTSTSTITEGELHYLIAIGECGLLQGVVESGSPTFSITTQAEQVL
jgi:hypothetical protein